MIADFERRLADLLSARLPAPFTGLADTPPGVASSRILVGVAQSECLEPHLGSTRPETVPPISDPRRVVRLRCTVAVQVVRGEGQTRRAQVEALDATLYTISAPDLLNGQALRPVNPGDDQGFVIQAMRPQGLTAPLQPTLPDAAPVGLTLSADGWFWPVNAPGQAGVAIAEVRVRGAALPLTIAPARPVLTASGPPVELTIRVDTAPLLRLRAPDSPVAPALPFGRLVATVVAPGERPGAGSLSGGAAGASGARLLTLTDDRTTVTYTPPAGAATDSLVLALDDGADGPGLELGRWPIVVREA